MNLPFDTTGLDGAEIDNLNETYAALSKKYSIDYSCREKLSLNSFDLMRSCHDPNRNTDFTQGGILKINTPLNECYLVFLKLRYYHTDKFRSGEGLDYFGYQASA